MLEIVKASPQFGQRTDDEWERYAAKWGIVGDFVKTELDTSYLAEINSKNILGTSRSLDDQTISDKQSGKSPIGPTIITRTPNERAQTFVIDGTHSLAARVRSYQQAVADSKDFSKTIDERRAAKKIRDANAKTTVIISESAAEYLALDGIGGPTESKGYNPSQPRVPAGSPQGGQFASAGGAGKSRTFSGGIRGDYEPQAGDTFEIPAHGNRYGFSVKVHKVEGDVAHIGYSDSDKFTVEMPKGSVKHFANDLSGIVDGPPDSGNAYIDAVISGEAKFLGKGNDGVVFEHDGKIIKASTTVPFQPFNRGHLSTMEAKDRLKGQFETAKEMHKAGVPGIMKQSLREHGEKAFVIRDKLEIPEKFTPEQIEEIRGMVQAAHDKGYTFNDWIQVGVGKDGKLYHFDTGNAKKSDSKHDRQSDMWEIDAIVSNDMQARKSLESELVTKDHTTQPRQPAGTPIGGQFASKRSAAHAAAAAAIMAHVDAGLDAGDPIFREPLKPEQQAEYRAAFSAVLDGMNEKATIALSNNLEAVSFYPNAQWLTKKVTRERPQKAGGNILGAWEYDTETGKGRLHLDGGFSGKEGLDAIKHVYAHEISHAIDRAELKLAKGMSGEISKTANWVHAYSAEILPAPGKAPPLSKYATTNAGEGWAEFGRLAITAPSLARWQFPQCYEVWERHGYSKLPPIGEVD